MSAREDVRCHHCSDVIGVYEPMILLRSGAPVRTSRAAVAGAAQLGDGPFFHPECFVTGTSDPDSRERPE